MRNWISGVALLVILGAGVAYNLVFRANPTHSPKVPGRKSPVIIVGGSTIPYAVDGWTCTGSPLTSCVSGKAYPWDSLTLNGVTTPSGASNISWSGMYGPWTLWLDTRTPDGKSPSNNGVQVTFAGRSGKVTTASYSVDATLPAFYDEWPDQKNNHMLFYWDTHYTGFTYANHIYRIRVLGSAATYTDNCSPPPGPGACTYFCPDGQCQVYIGNELALGARR